MKTNKSHDINECFYLYYKHNQGRTIKVLAEEVSLSESTVNRRIKHAKQIIVNNYSGMTLKIRVEGADKILDYYRASKGAFLCIQKNKRILHYGYIIKQSL